MDTAMNANEISDQLLTWTIKNSGAEQRQYLGMSAISSCPAEIYRWMTHGRYWETSAHLSCYSGYLFESDIKHRLMAIYGGRLKPGRELVADFDPRFVGHTDGELDDLLLEIKSVTNEKLERIRHIDRRIPRNNYEQVQCYMRHGGYQWAVVVYVARDTGALWAADVPYSVSVAERLDEKARSILAAVDANVAPKCACGRCRP